MNDRKDFLDTVYVNDFRKLNLMYLRIANFPKPKKQLLYILSEFPLAT